MVVKSSDHIVADTVFHKWLPCHSKTLLNLVLTWVWGVPVTSVNEHHNTLWSDHSNQSLRWLQMPIYEELDELLCDYRFLPFPCGRTHVEWRRYPLYRYNVTSKQLARVITVHRALWPSSISEVCSNKTKNKIQTQEVSWRMFGWLVSCLDH